AGCPITGEAGHIWLADASYFTGSCPLHGRRARWRSTPLGSRPIMRRDWKPGAERAGGERRAAEGGTMLVQDLRDWIARVDEMGQLTRIAGADPNLELGGLVDLYQWDMGNPALLFDHIVGYRPGYRLLANIFTAIPR